MLLSYFSNNSIHWTGLQDAVPMLGHNDDQSLLRAFWSAGTILSIFQRFSEICGVGMYYYLHHKIQKEDSVLITCPWLLGVTTAIFELELSNVSGQISKLHHTLPKQRSFIPTHELCYLYSQPQVQNYLSFAYHLTT